MPQVTCDLFLASSICLLRRAMSPPIRTIPRCLIATAREGERLPKLTEADDRRKRTEIVLLGPTPIIVTVKAMDGREVHYGLDAICNALPTNRLVRGAGAELDASRGSANLHGLSHEIRDPPPRSELLSSGVKQKALLGQPEKPSFRAPYKFSQPSKGLESSKKPRTEPSPLLVAEVLVIHAAASAKPERPCPEAADSVEQVLLEEERSDCTVQLGREMEAKRKVKIRTKTLGALNVRIFIVVTAFSCPSSVAFGVRAQGLAIQRHGFLIF
ncbi:hypothetical protein Cgig2_017461 [Carnegiea gigantea]|uniref:Uncharacterized protein n=1 Tax=Carnegiea gigantea TaxID=171969 RepID=A0A9Q1GZG6_9CARY|nr:hypothetical protein Cgig2_017461 [Carnegiea gigantea]